MTLFPPMTRQSAVHVMAGAFIMISIGLGYFVHPGCLIIAAFVGANLFQYGFTQKCPAETIFGLIGFPDATCPLKTNANANATTTVEKKVQPKDSEESKV